MAIDQINWSQFLQPGSELPPDVTFQVVEERPGRNGGDDPECECQCQCECEKGDNHECKTSKVRAHKFLLAGVSPVFRKQFFGPLKTTEDTVDIKDTTIEAFTTMISYIYEPSDSKTFSLSDITCPQALCELLNLSERYEMLTMGALVCSTLESLPITSENMMFTATVAKDFAVFENVSEMLLGKCSEYCTTKLKTSDDVFNFLKDTQDNYPGHDKDLLLDLMRRAAKCRNCLQRGSKCKDGEEISGSEAPGVLRAGLVVARREPGKSTICGFPCTVPVPVLFPMPGEFGTSRGGFLYKRTRSWYEHLRLWGCAAGATEAGGFWGLGGRVCPKPQSLPQDRARVCPKLWVRSKTEIEHFFAQMYRPQQTTECKRMNFFQI